LHYSLLVLCDAVSTPTPQSLRCRRLGRTSCWRWTPSWRNLL